MSREPGLAVKGSQCPDSSAVREQLGRILVSPGFARSDRISELLRFLVERCLREPANQPKEAVLGVEAFGRTPGYDTQADPVVRVTARRLRSKLKRFYLGPGKDDPVEIELPVGGYALEFSFREQVEPQTAFSAEKQSAAVASAQPLSGPGKSLFDHFHKPRAASQGLRQFAGPGVASHPVFSPDGNAIAFDWKGPDDTAEAIYVQGVDADGPARLSRSTSRELRPAWSPDGRRIAFLRERGEGWFEVRTAPVFGVGDCPLAELTTRPGDVPRLDWSPDGKVLATSGRVYAESEDVLLLILVEGGVRQQITAPPFGCWGDDEAIFSPAGNMLAFRRRTAPGTGDVYLHPMMNDVPERRLTWDECDICGIAWSPAGDSLIVSSRREGDFAGLWRISLSNPIPVRLGETGAALAWPAVSHRGNRLTFVRQSVEPGDAAPAIDGQIMVVEGFR
jgi:hypothetical protein